MRTRSKKEVYSLNSKEEDLTLIRSILNSIKEQVDLIKCSEKTNSDLTKKLKNFESLKGYDSIEIFESFRIGDKSDSIYLIILIISSTVNRVLNKGQQTNDDLYEYSFLGLTNTNISYPRTFIRPETLLDKFSELLNPIEVDFPQNKSFSKNYYVLTQNEIELRKGINDETLEDINRFKNLELELLNKDIIIRRRTRVNQNSAYDIINLLGRLSNK